MKKIFYVFAAAAFSFASYGQQTPFEISNGKESATYFQAIAFYKKMDGSSSKVLMREAGSTDANYPLHVVLVSNDGKFDPAVWHKQNKVVILVNNGIHPGEPDGIDASMMLVRDIVSNKVKLPDNVVLAIIPVYNIGGCLNRNSYSRANQNGPVAYGFRGNSQNLDLNRDFTKNDSRESKSFAKLFHSLDPDILIDNHVSDGADYQHVMTLLTTQYDKLGGELGQWLKNTFEPSLYKGMTRKGWDMVPYVNFETEDPDNGMYAFYDPPRYSSGYAALFHTIGFVPETHMLKPFADRVRSTYSFMQTVIEEGGQKAKELIAERNKAKEASVKETELPLGWKQDSSRFSMITFKGYEKAYKVSEVTGLQRMYYDRSKPFTKHIKYYDVFTPQGVVKKPTAYIVPHGWGAVIDLLRLNNIIIKQLNSDSTIEVETYHIDEYKSFPKPYEKHHKNYSVKVSSSVKQLRFLKGDYIIPLGQLYDRYIVEMLEPAGDDSFFAWNFFDAILQQKEGYSDYRWEDIAAKVLKKNPDLGKRLEEEKASDTAFAHNSSAQLYYIYINSPYYEPSHLRYPVFRILASAVVPRNDIKK
jgi:hypothetical protein